MLIPSLLCLLIAFQSDEPQTTPEPHPLDRVVELELAANEPLLYEYESEFEGTLHVWTSSELDLALRIEGISEEKLLAEDDNSGGGTTPHIGLEVKSGDKFTVIVARTDGAAPAAAEFALHLIAAPESQATRDATKAGIEAERSAGAFLGRGELVNVREVLESALPRLRETRGAKFSQLVTDELYWLGVSASEAEMNAAALEARKMVASHRERTLPADHADLLKARGSLAYSMSQMGDLAGARALREAVLEARERTLPENHPGLLKARLNLAVSMSHMGDLAGARGLHEAVLEAYERTVPEDHPLLLNARLNLANSMSDMGDLAGARALYEVVLEAYERTLPEDHLHLLTARQNLANSMSHMGDLAGARALKEAVLEAYERTLPEDHADLLAARNTLAVSMLDMGDLAGARALQETVLEAYERTVPEDHPGLLNARGNLAVSMSEMGDLAGARALCESVLEARERTVPEDHPKLLNARLNLASSMYQMGDLAGARALLPRQCEGMKARVLVSLALAPRQARATVGAEGQRLAELNFFSESGESETRTAVFELMETMRLVASEAARSLASFADDSELAPILAEADELRRAQGNLIGGAAQSAMSPEEVAAELTRLSLERDRLERQASLVLAERRVVTQPVEAALLAGALGEQEAAVGFRRLDHWYQEDGEGKVLGGGDHLLAHVLRSDGSLTRVDLGPAAELEELAADWRAALGAALGGTSSRGIAVEGEAQEPRPEAGIRLRERLIDPILAAAGEGVDRLFVCADDLVYSLPLDALPLGDEHDDEHDDDLVRLGDRIRIVNEVSFARLIAPQPELDGEESFLALGGVDYDADPEIGEGYLAVAPPLASVENPADLDSKSGTRGSAALRFSALAGTEPEAESSADLFDRAFAVEPTLLTKKASTKAALFEAAPGKRYIHLATHGWFAPESVKSTEDSGPSDDGFTRMSIEDRVTGFAPMTLCGLALAGANHGADSLGRVKGILTAEELCTLDLSQCELAVLSACETNVGIRRAGQGIQSLQAALYAAGARTSITSLWKVDDAATRRLMELFYTNLWIEKMPKSEALWSAKVTMREEGHPPAHWAAWVMTGDPE